MNRRRTVNAKYEQRHQEAPNLMSDSGWTNPTLSDYDNQHLTQGQNQLMVRNVQNGENDG
jgi:hypothetical protein